MCKLRWPLPVLVCLTIPLGCKPSQTPRAASAGDAETSQRDAQRGEKLIESYRAAHERGDAEAFLRLICFDGAEADTIDTFRSSFDDDRKLKIRAVRIVPTAPGDVLEYERNGVRFVPNLRPAGWLRIEFDTATQGVTATNSTQYLVAVKDGVYRIATSRPQ